MGSWAGLSTLARWPLVTHAFGTGRRARCATAASIAPWPSQSSSQRKVSWAKTFGCKQDRLLGRLREADACQDQTTSRPVAMAACPSWFSNGASLHETACGLLTVAVACAFVHPVALQFSRAQGRSERALRVCALSIVCIQLRSSPRASSTVDQPDKHAVSDPSLYLTQASSPSQPATMQHAAPRRIPSATSTSSSCACHAQPRLADSLNGSPNANANATATAIEVQSVPTEKRILVDSEINKSTAEIHPQNPVAPLRTTLPRNSVGVRVGL